MSKNHAISTSREILINPIDVNSQTSYIVLPRIGVDANLLSATNTGLYLPNTTVPEQYPPDELLSTQDLTEEDRKLAAALVAVQFVQQQKQQQQHLLQDAIIQTNSLPAVSTLGTQKIKSADAISHQQNLLVSSKRQNHTSRNAEKHNNNNNTSDRRKSMLRNALQQGKDTGTKTAEDEAIIGSDDSKKSLPHKKRISRKLKSSPQKKSAAANRGGGNAPNKIYKCTKCNEQFTSQASLNEHKQAHTNNAFACELCRETFDTQLKFFGHLKTHYEPTTVAKTEVKVDIKDQPQGIVLPPSNLQCQDCGKTFRRRKTYEGHIRDVHPKLEVEEFSEPEDLMDGIQVIVADDDDLKDNDNIGIHTSAVLSSHHPSQTHGHSINTNNINASMHHLLGAAETQHMLLMDSHTNIIMGTTGADTVDNKTWYREDELHATEADLRELEAQQINEEQHLTNMTSCDLCGGIYESREHLIAHLEQCCFYFKQDTMSLVSNLENTDDTNSKGPGGKRPKASKKGNQLACKLCDKVFSHRNSLVYHMRSHSGERPHQCDICGKSFFASSALRVHQRLHSGVKPYKCGICNRNFRQWGDLKYHCISIHSDEKQYQCEFCGKNFARKYSLIVHRRIHTGEKNYQCEFCHKTFRASSYLHNHRRIHTGEKPYPCVICGKPFRVRSDMKRHVITHTRKSERVPTFQGVDMDSLPESSDELDAKEEVVDENSMIEQETGIKNETVQKEESVEPVKPEEDPVAVNYSVPTESITARDGSTIYVWPLYMN